MLIRKTPRRKIRRPLRYEQENVHVEEPKNAIKKKVPKKCRQIDSGKKERSHKNVINVVLALPKKQIFKE